MRRIRIEHLTTYHFGVEVELGPHRLYLRPREGHDLRLESALLTMTPAGDVRWQRDLYGNSLAVARFTDRASTLSIRSEVVIQHFDETPLDFQVEDYALQYPWQRLPEQWPEMAPYLHLTYPADRMRCLDWAGRFRAGGRGTETFVLLDEMNRAISREFVHSERHAEGVHSPSFTLAAGAGSCRDQACLFMECCRALGLPARFVSGYTGDPSPAGHAGSTHAWSEVFLPGAGWVGFDSTSGTVTGVPHTALAVSANPAAVPPVAGTFVGPAGLRPTLLVGVRTTAL